MKQPERELRASLLVALCATALSFCWQFARVHFLGADNWTALFYTGDVGRVPPDELSGEHIYRFPNGWAMTGQCTI